MVGLRVGLVVVPVVLPVVLLGSLVGPATAAPAPRNVMPPSVSGTPATGETLTCNRGTWTDADTFAYGWDRDDETVDGATTATYVVTPADAGHSLDCVVTATGSGGSTTATSAPVEVPLPTGLLPGPCANAWVGTAGADDLRGTVAGDVLYGLRGRDDLAGLPGADCLVGGPGRDRMAGGPDDDRLDGGKAGDVLSGGRGDDLVRGSAGGDVLVGKAGRDVLVGGAGNDTLRARDGHADVLRCGSGQDVAVVDRHDRVSGCEVVRLR